jgi:hypothetical protein
MPMFYLCFFLVRIQCRPFGAASSKCNEFVNGRGSVAVTKPIHSHVPLAAGEFQLCVQ